MQRWQPCRVESVRVGAAGFELATARGPVEATRLVVASGGLSIPKIGASEWGYVLARRLGHRIVEPRPALVPFECAGPGWEPFAALAGVALPARIGAGRGARRAEFVDDLLFTHRGLSGPAALQASTYWRPGEAIAIDLAPGVDLARALTEAKTTRRRLGSVLADLLPRRLAEAWLATLPGGDRPVADSRDRDLAALAAGLHRWTPCADRHRGLPQGRGHRRRGRHPRPRLAQLRKPARPGAALHRRGRRRDRLAGRLQLPVGLGQRGRLRPGHGGELLHRAWRAIIVVFPKYRQICMTTVRVKENEPFDVALRRFKRTIEKLGLLTDLRAREFYEKPTAERKRKKAAAVKRHFKRVRSMQLPKKLF